MSDAICSAGLSFGFARWVLTITFTLYRPLLDLGHCMGQLYLNILQIDISNGT